MPGVRYIVAEPGYWDMLPATRVLRCRFTKTCLTQQPEPTGASVYECKATAVEEALATHRQLVRELPYSTNNWQYMLLITGQHP